MSIKTRSEPMQRSLERGNRKKQRRNLRTKKDDREMTKENRKAV
jgi:hypothetical protein